MTDEQDLGQVPPVNTTETPDEEMSEATENPQAESAAPTSTPPEAAAPVNVPPAQPPTMPEDDGYGDRLERLGGEPAPVITPEEFARLQRQGQVNIDARGRVRTTRRSDAEAGVSLRKRRAWYA
ncbi:MAG: hypothetical protein KC547_02040 [Anaerolineae bacterium]|nr:hypothetical protein [Anaerolineae bacterium]MCA9911621.1 hypothetical protein [Anaerolineae bacterium]